MSDSGPAPPRDLAAHLAREFRRLIAATAVFSLVAVALLAYVFG